VIAMTDQSIGRAVKRLVNRRPDQPGRGDSAPDEPRRHAHDDRVAERLREGDAEVLCQERLSRWNSSTLFSAGRGPRCRHRFQAPLVHSCVTEGRHRERRRHQQRPVLPGSARVFNRPIRDGIERGEIGNPIKDERGRQTGRIPPGRAGIVSHGDKRPTHAPGACAYQLEALGFERGRGGHGDHAAQSNGSHSALDDVENARE